MLSRIYVTKTMRNYLLMFSLMTGREGWKNQVFNDVLSKKNYKHQTKQNFYYKGADTRLASIRQRSMNFQ